MIDFNIQNSKLITFIEKCACKGVVLITSTQKTTKNFFNYFYMNIVKGEEGKQGYIRVLAIDSEERKMYIRHILRNVDVSSGGKIAIDDAELLLTVLKRISPSREINFNLNEEGTSLFIKTVEGKPVKNYEIKQKVLPEDVKKILDDDQGFLKGWDDANQFVDGYPVFSIKEGSATFKTKVTIPRNEIMGIIEDSIKLTREQDVKFNIVKEKVEESGEEEIILKLKSGKKSDSLKSDTITSAIIENPIIFENEYCLTNIHPIIHHLFNDTTWYFRIAGDQSLKFWIKSVEGDIELNFNSSSI